MIKSRLNHNQSLKRLYVATQHYQSADDADTIRSEYVIRQNWADYYCVVLQQDVQPQHNGRAEPDELVIFQFNVHADGQHIGGKRERVYLLFHSGFAPHKINVASI
jgi:hypothetical protein